jgi:hypothetical protein
MVIVQLPSGKLLHFNTLGYIVIFIMAICGYCMVAINKQILRKVHMHQQEKAEIVA